jgi:hypothetical protein
MRRDSAQQQEEQGEVQCQSLHLLLLVSLCCSFSLLFFCAAQSHTVDSAQEHITVPGQQLAAAVHADAARASTIEKLYTVPDVQAERQQIVDHLCDIITLEKFPQPESARSIKKLLLVALFVAVGAFLFLQLQLLSSQAHYSRRGLIFILAVAAAAAAAVSNNKCRFVALQEEISYVTTEGMAPQVMDFQTSLHCSSMCVTSMGYLQHVQEAKMASLDLLRR